MVFELRTYTPSLGRLDDLLMRFETITLGCWYRLGIVPVGFWVTDPADGVKELVYLLRWTSREEREERWIRFQNDPEWRAKRAETERNGTLVASIRGAMMEATSFSPMR